MQTDIICIPQAVIATVRRNMENKKQKNMKVSVLSMFYVTLQRVQSSVVLFNLPVAQTSATQLNNAPLQSIT